MLPKFDVHAALKNICSDNDTVAGVAPIVATKTVEESESRSSRNFRNKMAEIAEKLQNELHFYQAQYRACLAVRRSPEYLRFNKVTLMHEAKALEQLEKRILAIQAELNDALI